MAHRRRLFAGAHLRKIREERGLMQADLARQLAISPSYLSQLEHDDRPLTAKLVERLARQFPIEWQDFSSDDSEQLAVSLREAVGDPLFSEHISADSLAKLAEQQPVFARQFVELYEAFRHTSQRLEVLDEAISVDTPSGSRLPWEEVRDWFHFSNNYVDQLDRSAEELASSMGGDAGLLTSESMRRHLWEKHGIEVLVERGHAMRSFDASSKKLYIDSGQPASGIRFQIAYHVAAMTLGETIREIVRSARLRTDAARELLTTGLANYAAGAVLMPYEHFRRAAREFRHDVDRLTLLYRTSFEQTCHRLSTLQRDGARGLPVFFCRIDMAGNITKRHSATRFQFARFGGACPLWIAHEAVAIPDRVLVQLAETPDGARYVSMAKGLVKPSGRFDRNPRRYAVALGCEVQHASDFIYADTINISSDRATTQIGVSCRICPRADCDQRAYPPSDHKIEVNLLRRGIVPYEFRK